MLAILLAATISSGLHGTWTILASSGDRVHLNIVRDTSNWGQSIGRSELPLSDAQINSASETPVHFTLNRDAGVIDFNGSFENGEGVGRFSFQPNPQYVATLKSLGVSTDGGLDNDDLFSMAMFDIGTGFIREMQSLGLHEDLETYKRFKIHGVTTDFVREIRRLGFDGLSAEDLVRFRIHGVTPEFIRSMRDLGVGGISAESVVRMRIHGVSTDFVRELRDLGYTNVPSEDLIRMRIHGVSTDFIRELEHAGYHAVPIEKLVQMRIHGIDPAMLARGSNQ
jgi:hypothetical protein